MQKFTDYHFRDKHPQEKLENIFPVSERAFSFMNRVHSDIKIQDGALNIIGILDILESLEYHFSNFVSLKNTEKNNNQKHEVVAYLNRIGQLYYLSKSKFIKQYIQNPESIIKKSYELIPFRMKNTAHRSLDTPKNETEYYQNRQALALLGIETNLFLGKEEYPFYFEKDNNIIRITFEPETDHEIIVAEIYSFLEKIVKNIT